MTDVVCDLCKQDGGEILVHHDHYRIVQVDDAAYPGFCRVIWQHHVKEMTDLAESDRLLVMKLVWAVEAAVREVMRPDKVNIASLGNMTPHVHWHVIPRFADDASFPGSVWSPVVRETQAEVLAARIVQSRSLKQAVLARVQALQAGV